MLAGSRARWATSTNTTRSATSTSSRRPPDRRADAQPLPQPILRPCATQPREATISTSPPRAAAAACSGVTTGRSTPPAGPAPRGRPGRPRSCGSPWRPSSRSAGVLPSRIRRKPTRPGQPIAMRNSSTSAIGRTTGRRPSTSAPISPRSTRSSSPAAPDLPPFTLAEGPAGRRRMLARMEHHWDYVPAPPPRGANETGSISARSWSLKLVLGE